MFEIYWGKAVIFQQNLLIVLVVIDYENDGDTYFELISLKKYLVKMRKCFNQRIKKCEIFMENSFNTRI